MPTGENPSVLLNNVLYGSKRRQILVNVMCDIYNDHYQMNSRLGRYCLTLHSFAYLCKVQYASSSRGLEIGGSKSGKVLEVRWLLRMIYGRIYKYEVSIRVTDWFIEPLYRGCESLFWALIKPFSVIGFRKSGFVVHINHL